MPHASWGDFRSSGDAGEGGRVFSHVQIRMTQFQLKAHRAQSQNEISWIFFDFIPYLTVFIFCPLVARETYPRAPPGKDNMRCVRAYVVPVCTAVEHVGRVVCLIFI